MPPWVTLPMIWFLNMKNLTWMKSDDSRRLQPLESKPFPLSTGQRDMCLKFRLELPMNPVEENFYG
jgi:hypothetical protein